MAENQAERQAGADDAESELSSVMYIGHIPYGFFEEELASYFSQFGSLLRLRLSRNPKTGRSRGYAFIEFKYPEVARVAAQTMDGYLMFGNKLVCQVLRQQDLHKRMFFKWRRKMHNRRKGHMKRGQEAHNRGRSEDEHAARVKKLISRDARRQKRIQELGIDYSYTGFKDAAMPPCKKRKLRGDGAASVARAGSKSVAGMVTNDECLDLSDLGEDEQGCQMGEANDLEAGHDGPAGTGDACKSGGKSRGGFGREGRSMAVSAGRTEAKSASKGEKRRPWGKALGEQKGNLGTNGKVTKRKKKIGK